MKVLAADGISPKGIELLQKEFEVVVKDKLPAEELLEIIPDFDALIVRSASKVTAEVIARAKKLKIIGRAGVASTTSISRPRRPRASSSSTLRAATRLRRRSTRWP